MHIGISILLACAQSIIKAAFRSGRFVQSCTAVLLTLALGFTGPAYSLNAFPSMAVTTFLNESKWFKWALTDNKVIELAKIAEKPGGTKEVGAILGRQNLPNEALEDAFARILIVQGRAPRQEIDGWIQRIGGVPGFRSAMSKSMGASTAKTAGHMNEIRIADNAARLNYKVRGIGVPFNDPNKSGITDIDILLEKNGHIFAIEAKEYQSTTNIPLDSFRADMLSLAEYRRANPDLKVTPIFWITNKPSDPQVWSLLEKAAEHHQVELLVGSPSEAIHQIPLLISR